MTVYILKLFSKNDKYLSCVIIRPKDALYLVLLLSIKIKNIFKDVSNKMTTTEYDEKLKIVELNNVANTDFIILKNVGTQLINPGQTNLLFSTTRQSSNTFLNRINNYQVRVSKNGLYLISVRILRPEPGGVGSETYKLNLKVNDIIVDTHIEELFNNIPGTMILTSIQELEANDLVHLSFETNIAAIIEADTDRLSPMFAIELIS